MIYFIGHILVQELLCLWRPFILWFYMRLFITCFIMRKVMRDFTEIVLVLDKSGSMARLQNDVIGSVNQFVGEQANIGDNAALTIYQFNTESEVTCESVPIKKAEGLTKENYIPMGGTALNDCIGRAIDELGERLSRMNESDRPDKIVFAIQTDGEENSSKKFTTAQVKEKIKHQQDVYNWQFLFMGANIDAFAIGGSYGIPTNACLNFAANSAGVQHYNTSNTRAIKDFRTGKVSQCSYTP